MKSVRITQQFESDVVPRQKDKYAIQQQSFKYCNINGKKIHLFSYFCKTNFGTFIKAYKVYT